MSSDFPTMKGLMMPSKRGFGSDNNSGVHEDILKALMQVNQNHMPSYGNDEITEKTQAKFRELFGPDTETFFVFNGTAANVLSMKAMTQSFHAIICAETSHLNESECAAPEYFTGCKLIPLPTKDGKITIEQIEGQMRRLGDPHHAQPRVVSITQPTEYGTLYTPQEIKRIADFCHGNNLLLHVDGARIVNAAVALKLSLKELTTDLGIDVLSFGGTKNGLMFGETVVFLRKELAKNFLFLRKQAMQLPSKSRFIAAQFLAYFEDDLYLKIAEHVNSLAQLLAREIKGVPGIEITQKVESNSVFAKIPKEKFNVLREKYFFYVWNEKTYECRWMMTFDTTEEDVRGFATHIRSILRK